jgi:hypothetical protein
MVNLGKDGRGIGLPGTFQQKPSKQGVILVNRFRSRTRLNKVATTRQIRQELSRRSSAGQTLRHGYRQRGDERRMKQCLLGMPVHPVKDLTREILIDRVIDGSAG